MGGLGPFKKEFPGAVLQWHCKVRPVKFLGQRLSTAAHSMTEARASVRGVEGGIPAFGVQPT